MGALSLAAILASCSLGIVALLVVLAPVLRRDKTATPLLPEEPIAQAAFPESSRALRCLRCGSGDLAHVPRIALVSESPPAEGPLSLREPPRPVRLELVACTQCGHAEWFADSPRALEPFTGDAPALPPRRPYRD
jgi:hypothetical protein